MRFTRRFAQSFVPAFAAAVLLVAAQSASAQTTAAEASKIGFVSLDRILRDSVPAKAAQTKLETEFSKRQKDLQDTGGRLKATADKFDKDSPVLSDSERQRRQRELADMDKDFQRRQREFNEDINQRKNEELAAVVDRANKVIRSIAESEKFDIVFQDAVYVNPKIDITEKVLKSLNATTAPTK
ncbi:MAG: OmpH family outer membrane protein [Burkholderiaceae bacterium]